MDSIIFCELLRVEIMRRDLGYTKFFSFVKRMNRISIM